MNPNCKTTYPLLQFTAAIILFLLSNLSLSGQPAITLQPFLSGLTKPVELVNAGDNSNRLFIVEQAGVIKVYSGGIVQPTPFLTLTDSLTPVAGAGERGLLSMAFHPDYESNGFFFVYYTDDTGALTLTRFKNPTPSSNVADPTTGKILLIIPHSTYGNHNGGHLQFGNDGYLYFGTGDGGDAGDPDNNAQNPDTLLGKMIRIDVDDFTGTYTIPPSNPYAGSGHPRDKIWGLGLRNPWRWSFDRLTHDMWLADVGQNTREEINFIPASSPGGLNFQWDCREGTIVFGGGCAITFGTSYPPFFNYDHSANGGISVTGGYVYRGSQFPLLYGFYIMADYNSGNGWLIKDYEGTSNFNVVRQAGFGSGIVSFGEAENGEIYMLRGSAILQVTSTSTLPVSLISFAGISRNGVNTLTWEVGSELNVKNYEIEYSSDGIEYFHTGSILAAQKSTYTFDHIVNNKNKIHYRLKMIDLDGNLNISKVITVNSYLSKNSNFVNPSIIKDHVLRINTEDGFTNVQVMNMEGKLMWTSNITGRNGNSSFHLPYLRPGNYMVRITGPQKHLTQKILIQ